jgi:hypothetical protein
VRLVLERGRVRASSGDPGAAIACLRDDARLARAAGLRFLWIDALHMLAIADVDRSEIWVTEALAALEEETDPRTRRWAVSLHDNLGWTRFEAGAVDAALTAFEAALDAAERFGTASRWRGRRRRSPSVGPPSPPHGRGRTADPNGSLARPDTSATVRMSGSR